MERTTSPSNLLSDPSIYHRQCQILSTEPSSACMESMSLTEVLGELNQMYCQQIKMLTDNSPQDLHRKCQLLSRWCDELLLQTASLIDCITTLEQESCHRLATLNTHHNAHNRIRRLDNDLQNLIELIVRKQRTNCWDTTGMLFYDNRVKDILTSATDHRNCSVNIEIMTAATPTTQIHYNGGHAEENQCCCCNETLTIETVDSKNLSLQSVALNQPSL